MALHFNTTFVYFTLGSLEAQGDEENIKDGASHCKAAQLLAKYVR